MLSAKTVTSLIFAILLCIQVSVLAQIGKIDFKGRCQPGLKYCDRFNSKYYYECRFGRYKRLRCGDGRRCRTTGNGLAVCSRRR
ncbi:hypothetical protein AYI70_g4493 [Smittium culicis]|uniref:Uncharacterized protein n=1 Tax=Smittium culicis TaxID=133412 RepID=A0A1R1XZ37_9FUNG|nr:hypothetical protein AYI70_g4493 [Smittium culicis]